MHEPLYSVEEMRAAEARYPGYPESAPQLMERAGRAVADECIRSFPEARRFAVVCGGGSNGGDGRVAADYLRQAGRDATETHDPAGAEVVVDALFGTGFHGAPRPEAAAVIERINAANLPVVSVDVPSGVNASTGEIEGAAIEADVTVTFHGVKVGLVVAPGRFHAGRVAVARIGLEHAPTAVVRATPGVLRRVPRRGAPSRMHRLRRRAAARRLMDRSSPAAAGRRMRHHSAENGGRGYQDQIDLHRCNTTRHLVPGGPGNPHDPFRNFGGEPRRCAVADRQPLSHPPRLARPPSPR